jgi:hypothetical protein
MMNVNADNTPLAENVHVSDNVTTLVEVGLEIPYGGLRQLVIGPTSAGAKPVPETVTVVPIGPEVGLSEILGAVDVTVNVA